VTSNTAPVAAKANKFERFKAEKDGLAILPELPHFAEIGWEAMDETDLTQRLKWVGLFFRPVTPGKFMLRMRTPNGILSSGQMRVLAEVIQRYGEDGYADITTRQNIQLRGIRIEDVPDIFNRFQQAGLTSVQSGMDNVRNITGSPVAGIDADELIDTRGLVRNVQDMITNNSQGNPVFTNLPRKFNIAIAGGRDNSVHAEINDIAFVPAYQEGKLGFNVLVGGFFSAKRCAPAIPLNVWVDDTQVVAISKAILVVYRDNGLRANRHQARLMWLIDEWGVERFRAEVEACMGVTLRPAAAKDEFDWDKRDHIGVHRQKQPGLNFVGLHVPVGRLYANDMFELARMAEVYGSGEIRLTVEQNVIIPNLPDSRLQPFLQEPLLEVFSIAPAPLARAVVSCTGSQFCNFALIETKNRAVTLIDELEDELEVPKSVRFHWTGCPNACGQPQVADIGLMGTKTRKDGKTVEAVDIFMGGKVGKDAQLGEKVQKAIPCDDLKAVLKEILIQQFGAQLRTTPRPATGTSRLARQRHLQTAPSCNGFVAPPPVMPATTLPVAPPAPPPPAAPPAQPALVEFAVSGQTVECDDSQSLLEIAEAAGVAIDSSCQSGTCGTCKQKLIKGEITYAADPEGLEAEEQAAGYILTCIAHPVGHVILSN
jgi:ferredoxin-nitrite reductase